MANWGVFAVSRGIWGDEDFAPEPFTEREAWMWLISAAAFKPRRVFVGRTSAMIERGEFLYSLRFLERKWMWGKNRVSRFLKRLENRDMIEPTIRDGARIYSIKNYNKFQVVGLPTRDTNGTAVDTAAGHERDSSGTKKKQFEQSKNEERSISSEVDDAPPPRKNALKGHKAEFAEFYSVFPKHVARGAAEKAYVKAISRASPEIILAGAKRYATAQAREDPKFIQHPATWLNADRWLDEDGKILAFDPAKAAEDKEKADQFLRRGKYAETG